MGTRYLPWKPWAVQKESVTESVFDQFYFQTYHVKEEHAKIFMETLPEYIFIDKGKGRAAYKKVSFVNKSDLLKAVGENESAEKNKDRIIVKFELVDKHERET